LAAAAAAAEADAESAAAAGLIQGIDEDDTDDEEEPEVPQAVEPQAPEAVAREAPQAVAPGASPEPAPTAVPEEPAAQETPETSDGEFVQVVAPTDVATADRRFDEWLAARGLRRDSLDERDVIVDTSEAFGEPVRRYRVHPRHI
ncbi:MAG: hypothetical protein ACRDUY_04845, partial [Nitriliruptorales bacterium]